MLFGFLILSISFIQREKFLYGAFFFVILLNLKHIFLYIAPAYGIYYIRSYLFDPKLPVHPKNFQFSNFFKLLSVIGSVFMFSLGPFVYLGQLNQLLARLFPFKRGLVHTYWAPNFWALYLFLDIALGKFFNINYSQNSSPMNGIIGSGSSLILKEIIPIHTVLITILSMLPSLIHLWKYPNKKVFTLTLIQVSLSSFFFGWHVHEKAILMVIIPFGLVSLENKRMASIYLLISVFGHYSLMPLLYHDSEKSIRVLLVIFHFLLLLLTFYKDYSEKEFFEYVKFLFYFL